MDPTNAPKQFHHAIGGPPAEVLPPPAFIIEPPANGKVPETNGLDKKALNFSIQTGEEFSLEFMRDKVLNKKPLVSENNGYVNGASTIVGIGQSTLSDSTKITVERVSSSKASHVERVHSASKFSPAHMKKEISNQSYLKMLRGLCSFNGKILPRPSDGKLRYVGGDTRIIQVPNGIQWLEFKQRMIQVYDEVNVVKYQLPGEGLDILITVSNDEDLHNMLDEWNELDSGTSKLRIFLFSRRDLDELNTGLSSSDRDTESLYVSAINEVCSRRSSTILTVESSSVNHSDGLDLLSSIPQANIAASEKPSLFFLDPVDDVPIVENQHPVPCLKQKIEDAKLAVNDSVALLVDVSTSQRTYFSENFPKEQSMMVNRLSKSDESLSATPQRSEKAEVNPVHTSVADACTNLIQPHGRNVEGLDCEQLPTPISQSVSITNALEDSKLAHDFAFIADHTKKADILIDIGERFPPDFLSEILSNGKPHDEPIAAVNMNNPETSRWPYFQKPAHDDFGQNNVSLIDQDHIPHVNSKAGLSPFINDNCSDPEPQSDEKCDDTPSFHPILSKVDITNFQIVSNKDLEELVELGSGTFGTVYHGKWRGTDVAIKRLKKICFSARSSEQERMALEFWHETEILSKLHHPNVVAFYGVVQDGPDDTLATVTEFMVDGSLRQVILRKDIVLDHRKKLIIAMDAAFGMEYLHSKNIVHFDLKCDNLLVNLKDPQRPICKVGDFGLSKIKRQTLVSGGVRGTLPWMAPELLNGSSTKVSEKVDVFSFGVVMWEILTGEEPYANMHYGAIIGGIVNNTLRPPIPMGCDPEWSNLMEQCWAPNPASRPSFTEVAYRLRLMSAAAPNHHRTSTTN